MALSVFILDGAKDDYREIRKYVKQTRVIYEVAPHSLYLHMFVSTRRDFVTMLAERVLKSE